MNNAELRELIKAQTGHEIDENTKVRTLRLDLDRPMDDVGTPEDVSELVAELVALPVEYHSAAMTCALMAADLFVVSTVLLIMEAPPALKLAGVTARQALLETLVSKIGSVPPEQFDVIFPMVSRAWNLMVAGGVVFSCKDTAIRLGAELMNYDPEIKDLMMHRLLAERRNASIN